MWICRWALVYVCGGRGGGGAKNFGQAPKEIAIVVQQHTLGRGDTIFRTGTLGIGLGEPCGDCGLVRP